MERLKLIMQEFHINKTELAEIAGATRQTVHNYIHGKTKPDIDFICKVADYCGCSVDYVLGRTSYINEKELVDYTIRECIRSLEVLKQDKDVEYEFKRDKEKL